MPEVKKKKHVSKKNKKDWRKYCDIKDVEDFLEDQRLDERLGKFETKPDSELFVIDTGSGDVKSEDVDEKPILSAKLRKRAALKDLPKCFEILIPSSKVQDPNAKRNHVNPIGFKPTALSKLTEKRCFEKGKLKKKLDDAKKNRKLAKIKKRKAKQVTQNFNLDLWGKDVPEVKSIPETLIDEFIPQEAQLHNVLPTQRLRRKPPLPQTVVTRSAIDIPHPGVSYNPTFQEHQELLQDVVKHEEKMMKREAHLNRVTTKMFKKVTAKQKEDQWQEEMSAGLQKPHDPSNEPPDSESDGEYKAINPPVKNKKKDHKTRRKQKERIEERERLKREKIDKKKITDIYKLRKLQLSVLKRERHQSALREKREVKRKEKAAVATPILNAHKTPVKEPDFVDPEQLTGDLRNVAANGKLLRERFESLQRRGALAASKVMMKKKRRVKSYFKPGHKVTDRDIEKYIEKNKDKK